MKRFLLALIFCLVQVAVMAQEEGESVLPINTDRPTQSASAYTVGQGVLQFETGFLYQKSDFFLPSPDPLNASPITADIQSFAYNSTLIRYGISDRVELRFTQDLSGTRFLVDNQLLASTEAQLLPTYFGAKVGLVEEMGARPEISILANIGGTPFSSVQSTTTFDFRFNFQHQLTKKLSLTYNLGGVIGSDFIGLYTLVGAYSLGSKVSAFVELFGFLNPENTPNDHRTDFGLIYLINPNLQLDLFSGVGFSDISPNSTFGFGFSARITKK